MKQFASNVKLLTETYWIDQDEVLEKPSLKNESSIDEFINTIGEKVLVKELNELLVANGLKKGNRDKNEKLRAILMHGVDEDETKGDKDKNNKTQKNDDE